MIDKPGVYKISMVEYQADPCAVPSLSRSVIKDLLFRSPRHAWENHPRLNPCWQAEESEKKFDIGSAAHSVFLEGIDKVCVVPFDDWRKKEAKEARDEARASGKIPLLAAQAGDVRAMVVTGIEQLKASELNLDLSTGQSELTYIWQEGVTWFKIRPDWIGNGTIIDYKTTSVLARPDEYSRLAISTGLDIQDSLYCRGVTEVSGTPPRFIFMVQEINPPYLCAFFSFDAMTQDMGNQKVERGIQIWRECMASGKWPGYPPIVQTLEAPPWALAAWESRQFDIGLSMQGEL